MAVISMLMHVTVLQFNRMSLAYLHNFSADYARTLNAWEENFENSWPTLHEKYGEPFRRMWRYYLKGCEALFAARMVQLYQIVYSKGGVPGGYEAVR